MAIARVSDLCALPGLSEYSGNHPGRASCRAMLTVDPGWSSCSAARCPMMTVLGDRPGKTGRRGMPMEGVGGDIEALRS
jgi:hypothetical protein